MILYYNIIFMQDKHLIATTNTGYVSILIHNEQQND